MNTCQWIRSFQWSHKPDETNEMCEETKIKNGLYFSKITFFWFGMIQIFLFHVLSGHFKSFLLFNVSIMFGWSNECHRKDVYCIHNLLGFLLSTLQMWLFAHFWNQLQFNYIYNEWPDKRTTQKKQFWLKTFFLGVRHFLHL